MIPVYNDTRHYIAATECHCLPGFDGDRCESGYNTYVENAYCDTSAK